MCDSYPRHFSFWTFKKGKLNDRFFYKVVYDSFSLCSRFSLFPKNTNRSCPLYVKCLLISFFLFCLSLKSAETRIVYFLKIVLRINSIEDENILCVVEAMDLKKNNNNSHFIQERPDGRGDAQRYAHLLNFGHLLTITRRIE